MSESYKQGDGSDSAPADAPRLRFRFRHYERLRKRSDFDRVFAQRCSVADGLLVVYAAPNELEWSRIGISVSRKVGRAVVRNRIKRRIREAFRRNKHEWPSGFDFVLIPRAAAAQEREIAPLLLKLAERAVSRSRRRRQAKDRP